MRSTRSAGSLVFLGGGRIASALVAGLRRAGYAGPIVVHDHNPGKLRALRREQRIVPQNDLQSAVAQAGMLVIAVRPQSIAGILRDIGQIDRRTTAVSLAAGIPFARLRCHLGSPVCWARAMPSPVCRSGRGLTALAFDRGFPASARARVSRIFRLVGKVVTLPESQFDAFTVTYSSSHGYHALAALAEAAEGLGLNRKTALLAAGHALADGIDAWREGTDSLAGLLREAATPGGVASAVMSAMEEAGFTDAIQSGLEAGIRRAKAVRDSS